MEKKTCYNCKYSCEWLIDKKDPERYYFFCEFTGYCFNDNTICEFYQKDSRLNEDD